MHISKFPSCLGESCKPIRKALPDHMMEGFEGSLSMSHWALVEGGDIGLGCGSLTPHAHGKTLYFNGCGRRQAITQEFNTYKIR